MDINAKQEMTHQEREWLSHLQRAHEKGQVLAQYAQENKLCKKALYRWHAKLRQRGWIGERETLPARSAFVPMRVEVPPVQAPWRVVFSHDVYLELPAPQTPPQCAMLLQALRALS